jgi:hypothetical protein
MRTRVSAPVPSTYRDGVGEGGGKPRPYLISTAEIMTPGLVCPEDIIPNSLVPQGIPWEEKQVGLNPLRA